MKKTIFTIAMIIGLSVSALAKDPFKLVHVKDLAGWISKKPSTLFIFDANGEKTRKENGKIPGAILLGGIRAEEVTPKLPTNKDAKLVFYCANTQCMASHDAAKVAVQAGFKDVSVMADGIQGWVSSKQPVETVKN